jgi:hypothetical protein
MVARMFGVAAFSAALLVSSALAPVRAQSTMPPCPASDPVVWVNTSTHVYHKQGDPYFGKTKGGKYMCTSQATAAGARLSGSPKSGATAGAATTAASPTPKPKKTKTPKASPSPAS